MRSTGLLLVILACATACGARANVSTTARSVRYTCGDLEIVHANDRLSAVVTRPGDPGVPSNVGWTDDEGDHFVTFPDAITDVQTVEYLIPADPRADAIERVFDTSKGRSTADWRLTRQRTCRAHGGYNDAFTRWMAGSSLDEVASQLSLPDRSEARNYVHQELVRLNRMYYRDR